MIKSLVCVFQTSLLPLIQYLCAQVVLKGLFCPAPRLYSSGLLGPVLSNGIILTGLFCPGGYFDGLPSGGAWNNRTILFCEYGSTSTNWKTVFKQCPYKENFLFWRHEKLAADSIKTSMQFSRRCPLRLVIHVGRSGQAPMRLGKDHVVGRLRTSQICNVGSESGQKRGWHRG